LINYVLYLKSVTPPPNRIFNVRKSGITTVPNKVPKVTAQKGKQLVGKTVSADGRQLVTVDVLLQCFRHVLCYSFDMPREKNVS
jgi:hypothetical protein